MLANSEISCNDVTSDKKNLNILFFTQYDQAVDQTVAIIKFGSSTIALFSVVFGN